MKVFQTLLIANLVRFIFQLNPRSRLIFFSLGFSSLLLFAAGTWYIFSWMTTPTLRLVAGDETGDSYIISQAIETVVERRSKIKIEVIRTGGSKANLEELQQGKAELATTQTDITGETINLSAKATPRTVAVLYQDFFQLVVKDANIKEFSQLRGKTIALSAQGGQYQSFLKVAAHYGLKVQDFRITGLYSNGNPIPSHDDVAADTIFCRNGADAAFRVRALGNKAITDLITLCNGKLVGIPQAEAMQIKHPTFEAAEIPVGTYRRGNIAIPATENLNTIAVARLLVASDKVDKEIIREITQIVYEYRQEIANAIDAKHAEVKPLIANISRPPSATGDEKIPLPIHPGALAFYERDKPPFVVEHADFVAISASVVLGAVSAVKQAIALWQRRRTNQQRIEADCYINAAIKLMDNGQGSDVNSRQNALNDVFNKAAKALVYDRISQESFRTFNEAYKTTREAIERDRQQQQNEEREKADGYINRAIKLMQEQPDKGIDDRQAELNTTFKEAAEALVKNLISQESFRTFNEAYKTSRETIERDRQTTQQIQENKQREISAEYIKAVVSLLQDSHKSKDALQQELDGILELVASDLIAEYISQESFRTFVEAYKAIRDTIERKS
jgi:TRAP transporter TAXI family solute receptor